MLVDSFLKGMLTRAVLVVDTESKLIYQEICEDPREELDYQVTLNKINTL